MNLSENMHMKPNLFYHQIDFPEPTTASILICSVLLYLLIKNESIYLRIRLFIGFQKNMAGSVILQLFAVLASSLIFFQFIIAVRVRVTVEPNDPTGSFPVLR